MPGPVHIIGASGRSGAALSRALLDRSTPIVPVVRNLVRWQALNLPSPARHADLADPAAMRAALHDATRIVSCAHARYAPAIIEAAPPGATFVFVGSTRKFTNWPDAHGNGVLAGEAAFRASGRPGVMLHPTMIYGAAGEDNVQRLAGLIRRLSLLPLPNGGRSLVQPIHQDDITRCILAALDRRWDRPNTLVIAGPAPIPYADFVRAVAAASGARRPRIVSLPADPLIAAAALTRFLPLLPTIRPEEVRRLLEDKAFDIGEMRAVLGVDPIPLSEGLARTFAPGMQPNRFA